MKFFAHYPRPGKGTSSSPVTIPLLLCSLLVLAGGCKTAESPTSGSSSGSGGSTFVIIQNGNPGVVRGAAIDVFEEKGYKLARRDNKIMVFEKQASKMSDITWGNWTEARVWNRVKVYLEPAGESATRVSCTGYMVRDKGGATEEEIKPYSQSPYKKMLEQVGSRFQAGK